MFFKFTRARGQHLPGRVPAQTRTNSHTQTELGISFAKATKDIPSHPARSRLAEHGRAAHVPTLAAGPSAKAGDFSSPTPHRPPPCWDTWSPTPENLRHWASLQGADGRVSSRSRNPPAPTVGAGLRPAQTGAREGVPGAQHPTAGGEPAVRAAQAADDTKSTYAI